MRTKKSSFHPAGLGALLPALALLAGGCTTSDGGATVGAAQAALTSSQCAWSAATSGKAYVCHATSSAKNPYVLVKVDESGCEGHAAHAGDYIDTQDGPSCDGRGCLPDGAPDPSDAQPCCGNEIVDSTNTCRCPPGLTFDPAQATCVVTVPSGANGAVVGAYTLPQGPGFGGLPYDHESFTLAGVDRGGVGDSGTIHACNLTRGFCYDATITCTAVRPEPPGVLATVGYVIPDTPTTQAQGIAGVHVILQMYDAGAAAQDYAEYVASNQGLPFAVSAGLCHESNRFSFRPVTGTVTTALAPTP